MKYRRRLKLPPQRGIERLEDRLLLTGSPIVVAETEPNNSIPKADANPVPLSADTPVVVNGQIDSNSDIDLFQITMNFGDALSAQLKALTLDPASSLHGYLRLFDATGTELVNSGPFTGSDPALQFTDLSAGTNLFYIGIGDSNNTSYGALAGDNEANGSSTGNYTLNLSESGLVDAGDTIASATDLPLNPNKPTQNPGFVNAGGDVDLYRITMGFGDSLTAQLNAQSLISTNQLFGYLRVFDAAGNEVTNSGPFNGLDPNLQFTDTTAGTNDFYIGVSDLNNTSYDAVTGDNKSSDSASGIYVLNLSLGSLTDAGDTIANASDVPLAPHSSARQPGIIDAGGDVDLYHVSLKAGDTLNTSVDTSNLGGLGTEVRLFNQQGQAIDGSSINTSHLNFVAPTAGDYYLGVSADDNTQYDVNTPNSGSGAETGDYFVNFLVTPQDNDGTTATAHAVPFIRGVSTQPSLPFTPNIANPTDVDFYRLDHLVAGDTLQLNIDAASLGSSLAARLQVFGPNGEVGPDNGSALDASQTFTITTAGTYFVGVSGAENSTYDPTTGSGGTPSSTLGDYQLSLEVDSAASVTMESEPNNSINAPNVIVPGGSVTGSLTAGDVDYYMFTVTQPGLFVAHVNTPGSNLDSRLSINGSDQKLRMSSDNSAPGSVDPALELHLTPGTYWLAVDASPLAASGAATGDYSLDTTFTLASSPFAPQPTGPDGSSGLFPHGIATGDFNGDGVPDLVTADNGSGQISVLLGVNASTDPAKPRGDFSYQPAQLISVGFSPVAVVSTEVETGANSDGTVKEVPLDFNGDGITDLAIVNSGDLTGAASVTILYGDGQGNFHHRLVDSSGSPILDGSGNPVDDVAVGGEASSIAVADFNGDGRPDFAVTNATDGTVSIFLQQPDGSFVQAGSPIAVGHAPANPGDPAISAPRAIIAGDFDGDGHMDLATADSGTSSVTVLYGDGSGAFTTETLDLPPGSDGQSMRPTSLVAARLNGDNFFDFAVADANLDTGSDDITTILGGAGRAFQVNDPVVVKGLPATTGQSEFDASVAVADFNGDGKLDLALSDIAEARIAVVLGKGDGTFDLPAQQFVVNPGSAPRGIVVGDFNNDGRMDFATADGESEFTYGPNDQRSSITIFGGKGDGTFLSAPQLQTDATPSSLAVADFNDDGRADIITANQNDASLLLNQGDATFQSSTTVEAGPSNIVATGDFNGDGRMDVITTDYFDPTTGAAPGQLTLLLGKGDGTFSAPIAIAAFPGVFSVVTGDFNHDGKLDFAVTISQFDPSNPLSSDNSVVVFLGDGTGGFAAQAPIPVGSLPRGLAVGDFNGDGNVDLAVSNFGDGTVTVLYGDGTGAFGDAQTVAVGDQPGQLAVADFDKDGFQDIAVKCSGDDQVTILFGRADGNLSAADARQLHLTVADGTTDPVAFPEGIVAGDFNGDGLPDLATSNLRTGDVSVFLNQGSGHFAAEQRFAISDSKNLATGNFSIATGDFNGDGLADLATSNATTNNVSILLGDGSGKFKLADQSGGFAAAPSPRLVDFNGDNVPDSVTIDAAGRVLLRLGRSGEPGVFAPPIVVNADSIAAGIPAADFALINDGQQHLLGILGRSGPSGSQNTTITLYKFSKSGLPVIVGAPISLGGHYDRITTAKLNNGNRDDLVAINSTTGMLAKFIRAGQGFQALGAPAVVASAPSSLVAAHLGVGGIDSLIVADQATGALSVIGGGGTGSIANYRGSTDANGFDPSPAAAATPISFDGSSIAIVGNFNDLVDQLPDLAVIHGGTNSLDLLLGTQNGGFADPQADQEIATGSHPIAVATADFNGDHHLDLAVLNGGDNSISIFLGDGHGNFHRQLGANGLPVSFSAGSLATSLSVADVNRDGNLDLLVGNQYGDVTILLGQGNGSFQPSTGIDRSMAIAVGNVNGQPEWVVSNSSGDRLVVQHAQPDTGFTQSGGNGLMAPAGVAVADLDGDGIPDVVVANSGGNDVIVYLSSQQFVGQSFFAGTDPVDVQIADVDGAISPIDGQKHLDLIVTNYGSNDVSILLGTGDTSDGGKNLFTPGARLNAGQGPVSTQVVTHADGTPPDLLVTNSVSNNVYMLQSAGGGFYHDNTPTIFNTGRNPTQTLVGNFDGTMGFVTLNRDSNSLTFYSGFDSAHRRDLSSGGTTPITAVAADFNNDGMTDLIVGNNGNGVFSIFTGEQAGLSLTGGFIDNSLSHPAALAIGQFGQGKELQLLAVDEGDESVHVFGRENLVGDPNPNFNTQLLAATTTSLGAILGLNSSGLNFAVTITSALGLSLQGVLSQTSDTVAAEGGGTDVNRSLPLEIFDDLGTAVSGGQQLLESALASVGGALGLKFDEHHVVQTIEDVVAILFPHLPLHVLPSVIHNLLGSAPKKTSPGPVAIDQAMENYDAESWTDDLLQAIDESPDAVVPASSSGDEQGLAFSVERIGDVASIHFEPSRVAAIANQKQKQMVNMLEVRRMSALAAVMGAIGMGGWLYRSRRQRDEFDVSDGD